MAVYPKNHTNDVNSVYQDGDFPNMTSGRYNVLQ
jgi:hypothetical protein